MNEDRSNVGAAGQTHKTRTSSAKFYLVTLGKPTLLVNGTAVALNNRKSIALLCYLSTRDTLSESRERLAGLLWGDSSEEKARGSLRQTLTKFRDAFDAELLDSNRLDVWIAKDAVVSDHAEIMSRLESGMVDPRLLATQRMCRNFLEGFEDIDSGLRNWVMVYRQSLEDRLMRLLEDRLERAVDASMKRETATAILNIEPTHEPAVRALMITQAAAGDPTSALKIYKTLWDLLENDYDTEPTAETQRLVAKIKMGETPAVTAADLTVPVLGLMQAPAVVEAKERIGHSLFVSDFAIDDENTDRSAVVRIFRVELLAALTRFRDWRVFDYHQFVSPPAGLAHVVEARAYGEGKILRFVLTLRELPNGKFVWSERFSLDADGWFDTMQNMIRRIAVALEVNISSERLERVAGKPELSLALFDRWLRGQLSIFRWTPNDEAMAEQLYRSIIREAPNFAPAQAGMAGILNVRHLIFPGLHRTEEGQREALVFATRAVELDPLDSRTQLHLAWSHAMNAEFQKASVAFQLAFELNEDDPWTLVSAAEGLALCGNLRESLHLVKLAEDTGLRFSELQWSYQSVIWFIAGEYEKCIDAASRAEPSLNCCGAWAAAALGLTERADDAKAMMNQFFNRISDKWVLKTKPTDEDIVRWFLMGYPIASDDVMKRLVAGLSAAGVAASALQPAVQTSLPPTV